MGEITLFSKVMVVKKAPPRGTLTMILFSRFEETVFDPSWPTGVVIACSCIGKTNGIWDRSRFSPLLRGIVASSQQRAKHICTFQVIYQQILRS